MIIEIPFKTPSINHLYSFRGFNKFLSKEAKQLQVEIQSVVEKQMNNELLDGIKLKVKTTIYENWYYNNGKVAQKDIANREKFLIDAIFEYLGLDDKYIFDHQMIKFQSTTEEKAIIEILPFQDSVL